MKQRPETCGNAPDASGICATPVSSIDFSSSPVTSSVIATFPTGFSIGQPSTVTQYGMEEDRTPWRKELSWRENAFELELLPEGRQLVEEDLQAPVDRLRPVGAATAELVVEDNGTTVDGQPFERREVVMSRARPAVQAQERVDA